MGNADSRVDPDDYEDDDDDEGDISYTPKPREKPVNLKKQTYNVYDHVDDNHADNETYVEDDDQMEVLLEFIPYYGKDDPENDALVRSTLSNLSIAQIDTRDEEGNTLLLLACQHGCEDLVRMMLIKGADPNALNSHGVGCLHFACYRESASKAIAKSLLQHGAYPEIQESTYGCTPLHYCAGNGDLDFCKLLLTHGAQADTYDFYNYTCVDYAREAGMHECGNYLQEILVKATTNKALKHGQSAKFGDGDSNGRKDAHGNIWQTYYDSQSGQNYVIHSNTGECLWESDFLAREGNSHPNHSPTDTRKTEVDQSVITKLCKARLVGLFSKVDLPRLAEVDKLLSANVGKEMELMTELASKYGLTDDPDFMAFQKKLGDMKGIPESLENKTTKGLHKTASVSSMDASMAQALVQETSSRYEAQIEELKTQLRNGLSEKDGEIAKLQAQLESLGRAKKSLENDKISIEGKMNNLESSGNNALSDLEGQLKEALQKCESLESDNATLHQNLGIEKEKLKSLENSMSSLTAGHAEKMEAEKKAAEERQKKQMERETKFAQDIADVAKKGKEETEKVKVELQRVKRENEKTIFELKKECADNIAAKNKELDEVKCEHENKIASITQELSSSKMQSKEATERADAEAARADAAEALQKIMQNEIAEARSVMQFNTQLHKDLAREQLARKRLHNEMEDLKGRIRVYVRVRPFSKKEVERSSKEAVFKDGKLSVVVKTEDTKKVFDFDHVFGGSSENGNSQADVFKDTKHLIMSVVDGYNVCIFAYGQTGSGKTFTMIGAADIGECLQENGEFDDLAGITPRSVSELFRLLNQRHAQMTYVVEVSMFQLYRDSIDDLLAKGKKKGKGDIDEKCVPLKITLAEHSSTGLVTVDGAEIMTAETPAEVMKIFAIGSSRRTTASTQMNAESSRSHLICCLVVKQTNRKTGLVHVGKLTLVDLAGSERVDKSGATGEMLKEAQSINKSLSAIGDVISALTSGSAHVPYRNHPLTMLMSDSLGGNAKTLMFVNTSPADYNASESSSSLTFGQRCKDITNSVSAPGGGASNSQIKDLKKELARMKKEGKENKKKTIARPV